jgi:hypothetical protein
MYSARCMKCLKSHTYYQSVANRAETPLCCDLQTSKTLDAPMVSSMSWTSHKGFYVPGPSGEFISDGAAYKKFLDKNNYVPASEGHQEAAIQRKNQEVADDKKLEAAVTLAVQANS